MKKIAVIGSSNIDLVSNVYRMPKPGETLEAPRFDMGFGGKGANQAVAAARLGGDVLMVSKVGEDVFGGQIIENFQANGISTAYVGRVPHCGTGVASVFVDEETAQNSILIVKGANAELAPGDIDAALTDIRTCGIIVMQLEIPLETVYHVIELGAREHISVLLNPAPAVKGLDMEKISLLDIFVPNETELEILTDKPVKTIAEIEIAAKILVEAGVKQVIVTMGEKGALFVSASEVVHIPCPTITPRDTSGAGDAFIGCFAQKLMQDGDVLSAIKEAVIYASNSATKDGTQKSYATREEFEVYKSSL